MANSVLVSAPAKINLVLDLLGVRGDGYTEIATVLQTIALSDHLVVERSKRGSEGLDEGVELTVAGQEPCPARDNLAYRAAARYRAVAGLDDQIAIRLEKRIPVGAGLGGGSSDAAAVLCALERLSDARLGRDSILALARDLGADVPFLLDGGLAVGRGRGDDLEWIGELPSLPVVLVRSGPPLATAEVYARARARLTTQPGPPNIHRFLNHFRRDPEQIPPVSNMLLTAAAGLDPEILRLVQWLEAAGGRASMTGSGSAVFALFATEQQARRAVEGLGRRIPGAWIRRSRTITRDETARLRRGTDPRGR
ncbi:MAG: 4-(cytidine 5'-diphospho)-2-C-methyl-D-erythritol kinase [Acidobacteriota bacterium]|nr:MAG: 4-(cytidine 5'-diphospho)-2-C-methyl-D-erythritol kinase [Acidobacteriota bacterium]